MLAGVPGNHEMPGDVEACDDDEQRRRGEENDLQAGREAIGEMRTLAG